MSGRVDFPASGRQSQAVPSDVANSATVSLIDSSNNATAAATRADAGGNFSMPLGGWIPVTDKIYILEAVKGLGSTTNGNYPGYDAARLRTVIKYSGGDWFSISNGTQGAAAGGTILISVLTTAVAITSAIDPGGLPYSGVFGKIKNPTTTPALDPAKNNANHPDAEINALASDLTQFLLDDYDPVGSIVDLKPTITNVVPNTVKLNDLALITGKGFSPSPGRNKVEFGTVTASVLMARRDQLVVQVPGSLPVGTVNVKVTERSTTTPANPLSSNLYPVNVFDPTGGLPIITSVSPEDPGPGSTITILGSNLLNPSSVTVTGGTVTVVSSTAASIICTLPAGLAPGDLYVTNSKGQGNHYYLGGKKGIPTITSISPPNPLPGDKITIFGFNLKSPTAVTVTGGTVTINSSTDNSIICTLPATLKAGDLYVSNANGAGNRVYLTGLQIGAPMITSIVPESPLPGQKITILGSNLANPTSVICSGGTVNVNSSSANSIICTLPATLVAGDLYVTNASGQGNHVFLSGQVVGAPIISSIIPASPLPGAKITIFGFNLKSPTSVTVTGGTVTVVSSTDNSIVCTLPTGLGAGDLYVTNSKGQGNHVYLTSLQVGAPVITSISPENPRGGDKITIFGSNLKSPTSVTVTGGTVTGISSTDNSIICTLPAGLTAGDLYVTNSAGAGNRVYLTGLQVGAPVITSISPQNPAPGAKVTLFGYNLNGPTAVTLPGGSGAGTVTSYTDHSIVYTLPTTLVPGELSVTTAKGTSNKVWVGYQNGAPVIESVTPGYGAANTTITVFGQNLLSATVTPPAGSAGSVTYSSERSLTYRFTSFAAGLMYVSNSVGASNKFYLEVAPTSSGGGTSNPVTITSLSPSEGSSAGQTVTITGTGFNTTATNNLVFFGNKTVPATTATSTQITVRVPTGVTPSGMLWVKNPAGESNKAYFPIYAAATFTEGFTSQTYRDPSTTAGGWTGTVTAAPNPDSDTGTGTAGALTVTAANTTINSVKTYLNSNVSASATSIPVGSSSGFAIGDEILIVQMRHPTTSYVGNYEFKRITNISGSTLYLNAPLTKAYYRSSTTYTTQVLKVYQYTTVTVNSGASLVAPAWDGNYSGGILAFRARQSIVNNGTISAIGTGYRGGYGVSYVGSYWYYHHQGEGRTSAGGYTTAGNDAGGGGGSYNSRYRYYTRGAGGGHATAGTNGYRYVAGASTGGLAIGAANLSLLNFGGGGGSGYTTAAGFAGGYGGGIIFMAAPTITNNAAINANGASGGSTTYAGGGAAGTIYVRASTLSGAGAWTATGGAGASTGGGAGGYGRIKFARKTYAITGAVNPAAATYGYNGDPGNLVFASYIASSVAMSKGYDTGTFRPVYTGISPTASVPSGQTVSYEVSDSPDNASWSGWISSSNISQLSQRYVRWRATLTSNTQDTPQLSQVVISYKGLQ